MSNVIVINGSRIEVEGDDVSIINGEVIVGGKVVANGLSGIVKIKWVGDLAKLKTDSSVSCGDVYGDVVSRGSTNCKNIFGSLNSGGSVNCKKIGGKISAGVCINVL